MNTLADPITLQLVPTPATTSVAPMPTTGPTSVAQLSFDPEHDVHPSPVEWRDQIIYQILIDRFDDNADAPALPADISSAPQRPNNVDPGKFQGGKIRGIIRRLDYIQSLGATTVWISPPLKNRPDDEHACHGYGIQNFLEIDPRFGTKADLKELVRSAHARGMFVIMDIVINHTGDCWAYVNDELKHYDPAGTRHDFGFWRQAFSNEPTAHPRIDDAVWPVEFQSPEAYKRRGRIRKFSAADLKEAVDGDFVALKDLEMRNPAVLDALIKCHKYWIKELDLDGFRIDTVKHADAEPTAIFCNAIREYCRRIGKHNFFLFGEIVDNDQLLNKYIAANVPVQGDSERWPMLSAVLDFPLYFILEEVIKGTESIQKLRDRYESFRHYFRDFAEAGQHYVTFVDNHDQMSRPFRRFAAGISDPRQSVLAVGYLFCNIGIPCIYYGTEQGFDGSGSDDSAVREAMFGGTFGPYGTAGHHAFNREHSIYRNIARLSHVRKHEPALRYGRQYFREVSGDGIHFGYNTHPAGILAFSRVLDSDEVIVVINLDDHPREDRVSVDGHLTPPGSKMRDLLNEGTPHEVRMTDEKVSFIHVPLEARSMAILKRVRE